MMPYPLARLLGGGRMTIGMGLNQAGAALAGGLMNRWMQRKEQERREKLAQYYGDIPMPEQLQAAATPAEMMAAQGPGALARALTGPRVATPGGAPVGAEGYAQEVGGFAGREALKERLRTPISAENEQREKLRGLIRAGLPGVTQAAEAGIAQQFAPPGEDKWVYTAEGFMINQRTGEAREIPGFPRETKVRSFSPGNTYEVERPDGTVDTFKIPNGMEGKEIVNEALSKKLGFTVRELWERPKESDGPYKNTGLITHYGMTTQVQTGVSPLLVDKQFQKLMGTAATQLSDAGDRLLKIQDSFRPEFLSLWGRIGGTLGQVLDYLQAGDFSLLTAEQREWLADRAEFIQDVDSNVNLYIKEITGAQMSQDEAKRLMKAIANRKDSPTVFARKLSNGMQVLEAAKQKKMAILKAYEGTGMPFEQALVEAEKAAASFLRRETDRLEETGNVAPNFEPVE